MLLIISSLILLSVLTTVIYLGRSVTTTSKASTIASVISSDDFYEIYPLTAKNPIYKFALDGKVSLKSKTSYIRFILVDSNNNELLVYEAYPLLSGINSTVLNNACEETCLLGGIVPKLLKVYGYNTSYEISKIRQSAQIKEVQTGLRESDITDKRLNMQKNLAMVKINKINRQIEVKGFKWKAGETSISSLTYAEKRKLFSNPDDPNDDRLPNLQGLEYYKGGVFEIASDKSQSVQQDSSASSDLPDNFDYRNYQGENWMTQVKDQQTCGSCVVFSSIGTLEAIINLYYNQHLNFDLSEQQTLSCSYQGSCYKGWNVEGVLGFLRDVGTYEEKCWEYADNDQGCYEGGSCGSYLGMPEINVKINNFQPVSQNENDIKTALLQNGPLVFGLQSMGHAMVLLGWEIDQGSKKTIWYSKNSHGISSGESGYLKFTTDINDFRSIYKISAPIITNKKTPKNYSINCDDRDGDNYCYWGISRNRPGTCPATCLSGKDCNDLDPTIGSTGCISSSDDSSRYCQETSNPYNVSGSGVCNSSGTVSFTLPRDNDCDQNVCCSASGRRDRVCVVLSHKNADDNCKEGDSDVRYLADINHSTCPSSGDPSYIQNIPAVYSFRKHVAPVFRNGESVKVCIKDYSCRASDGSLDGSYWRCSEAFSCGEIPRLPTAIQSPTPAL